MPIQAPKKKYPNFGAVDKEQRERHEYLKKRKVLPNRFMDRHVMIILEINRTMEDKLKKIGCEGLMSLRAPTSTHIR